MKVYFKYLLMGAIIFLNLNCFSRNSGGKQEYETIVSFSKGEKIEFADFILEYVGEREQKSTFPNGNSFIFHYKDFTVSEKGKPENKKTISWSAGTGEIAPASFDFNGKNFTIELSHADKFKGWLKDDELVITKK